MYTFIVKSGWILPEASKQCYIHCSLYVNLEAVYLPSYCDHVPLYTYFTPLFDYNPWRLQNKAPCPLITVST